MMNKLIKLLFFLVILQIFEQFVITEGKVAKKFKADEFSTDILAGSLDETVVDDILFRNDTQVELDTSGVIAFNLSVAPLKAANTNMEDQIIPNGCYKQMIKEPDQYDGAGFIETERLICPPNIYQVPAVIIQQSQTALSATYMIQVPVQVQLIPTTTPIPDTTEASSQTTTMFPIEETLETLETPPTTVDDLPDNSDNSENENNNNVANNLLANSFILLLPTMVVMVLF